MWSEAEGELRDVKTRGLGESDGRDSGRLRAETLARFHKATDSPANKTDPRKRPEGGKLNTKDVNNNNKKTLSERLRGPRGRIRERPGYGAHFGAWKVILSRYCDPRDQNLTEATHERQTTGQRH